MTTREVTRPTELPIRLIDERAAKGPAKKGGRKPARRMKKK